MNEIILWLIVYYQRPQKCNYFFVDFVSTIICGFILFVVCYNFFFVLSIIWKAIEMCIYCMANNETESQIMQLCNDLIHKYLFVFKNNVCFLYHNP